MSNTEFFAEASKANSSITWRDIFSESFVKHTKADKEYAMQSGTVARQVPEAHMLETWNRPWLWWPVAKWGMGLILALYAMFFFQIFVLKVELWAFYYLVMIIPPLVIPLIIMIFLWEMNIPQNISLTDLLAFFLVGGIVSFTVTAMMIPLVNSNHASVAALQEEPAKLAASLLILLYIQKFQKKKIYGMTGLVVGAAVGAGFSGLESMYYSIEIAMAGGPTAMMLNQALRSVLAIGGHFAYCIPYTTAIALNAKNGKITLGSIFHPTTLAAFLISVGSHALWNAGFGLWMNALLVAFSTFFILFWIKQSLRQIVQICGPKRHSSGYTNWVPVPGAAQRLTVFMNTTNMRGMSRVLEGETMVGRQKNICGLCFDGNTPGVSRSHCKFYYAEGSWNIQDLNSTYGTYVNGRRLVSFASCPVRPGDQIHLGSKQVWLTIQ